MCPRYGIKVNLKFELLVFDEIFSYIVFLMVGKPHHQKLITSNFICKKLIQKKKESVKLRKKKYETFFFFFKVPTIKKRKFYVKVL